MKASEFPGEGYDYCMQDYFNSGDSEGITGSHEELRDVGGFSKDYVKIVRGFPDDYWGANKELSDDCSGTLGFPQDYRVNATGFPGDCCQLIA